MVTVNNSYYCPSYQRPQWEGSRPVPDPVPNDGDLPIPEAPTRGSPPATVGQALREQCHIEHESFFLAVSLGNGNFAYFSGPNPVTEEQVRKMFRRDKFLQSQNGMSPRERRSQSYDDHYSLNSGDNYQLVPGSKRRKRRMLQRELDNDDPPVITTSRKAIQIDRSDDVWDFYDQRFKCVQQTACKHIAKAFVKVIAPKKQANNPYTRGDDMAPDWWPKPWGPGEKDKVRHVEPDHLWKKERVYLLNHILRLVVEPREKQHPDIQRLNVNVAKLESAAMEALSAWFADTESPNNAKKRPILKEIFKVAKMEEKYKNNEIDGTAQVFVTADDMVMDYCHSDDEDEGDDVEVVVEDGDRSDSAAARASPAKTTTMPMLPSLPPSSAAVQALAADFQAAAFLDDVSLRGHQYSGPAMMTPPDLGADQYPYPEAGALTAAVGTQVPLPLHDMLSGPHHHHHHQQHAHDDASRRSSLFSASPADFAGPSPSTLYANPWQQPQQQQQPQPQPQNAVTASTAAQDTQPLYTYAAAAHHHHHHQQSVLPAPPQLPLPHLHQQQPQQQQQQPPNPYAQQHQQAQYAAATSPFDQQHHDVFRGGGLARHHHHHQQQQQQQHHHHQHQHQHQQQHQAYAGYQLGPQHAVKLEVDVRGGGGGDGGGGGVGGGGGGGGAGVVVGRRGELVLG